MATHVGGDLKYNNETNTGAIVNFNCPKGFGKKHGLEIKLRDMNSMATKPMRT